MSMQHTLASPEAVLLDPDGGEHFEFLNNRATVKVAAGDNGTMSVVEFLAPRGFGPPLHNHLDEDELFIIMDGTLAFHTGGQGFVHEAGSFALLPRGIPHTFQVLSDSARMVNVTASTAAVPRFDRMVSALGTPTDRLSLPAPSDIDPGRVAEICHANGIEIVGPPPAPLDDGAST